MGARQCAVKKKLIFSYLRVASFSVCLVVWAGVEPIDCARSDGCTVSVGIQPEKNAIFVSRGVNCMCAQCWAGHLIPRQRAGEIYEIYALPARFTINFTHLPLYTTLPAKIGTLHTLQHFTPGSVPSRAFIRT